MLTSEGGLHDAAEPWRHAHQCTGTLRLENSVQSFTVTANSCHIPALLLYCLPCLALCLRPDHLPLLSCVPACCLAWPLPFAGSPINARILLSLCKAESPHVSSGYVLLIRPRNDSGQENATSSIETLAI